MQLVVAGAQGFPRTPLRRRGSGHDGRGMQRGEFGVDVADGSVGEQGLVAVEGLDLVVEVCAQSVVAVEFDVAVWWMTI